MLRTGSSSLSRRCARAGVAVALALAGLSAAAMPTANATTTLTVSTTADTGAGAGACGDASITTPPSPLSLREATCLANNLGGDVMINLPADVFHLTNGELRLGDEPGQNTTIVGTQDGRVGTAIDAGGLSRVLELDFNLTGGVNTSISHVTITGGSDDTYGGAAIIAGSGNSDTPDSLTISDSWISGNQTSSAASYLPGGAVQFIGGSLTISNSTISNNSSGNSSGGGVFYQAQGVAAGESLSVTGSTFADNSAGTGDGGAIAVGGGAAALHYNRFTGNTAASGSAVSSGVGTGVDATEDWWGCNTGPGTTGCDTVSGGPAVSPRLVLTASASPATVTGPNATSTITATLTKDSLGATVDPAQLGAFDRFSVSWTDPQPAGATVSDTYSYLSAGSATTTYNSHAVSGAGQVLATLDQGTATATLTIVVGQPPVVTTNPVDQTVGVGASVSFSATASGVPTPTLQWQRSTDGGSSFADIAGATSTTYTFTAAAGDDGNQYRAVFTNVAGTATTTAATLNVGSAPAFTSADNTSFVVGQAGSFTVTTTGQPSAALSRTGAQFPAWLMLTDNGDGTGSLTGTPPAGSAGSYQFTLKAANGFSPSASQTFTLFVDDSPVITSADHSTFVVGQAGSFAVTTTAGFPVATGLTETGSLPSGVTFTDNGDGTATMAGTPAAGTGGSYSMTITATATGGLASPATQSFTLTVLAPPVITSSDHATFSVGSAGSFTVTTSAGNPAATTLSKTGTLPAGITFVDNGDGTASIAGTPSSGSDGVYTITITASNGVGTDATQTFTLTVNAPPVITSADHATFTLGTAAAFTVSTSSGQPTLVMLTETGSLPPGITFTDNGNGTATLGGTPTTGGSYSFTITASNGVLPDPTQTFTATVNASPSITSVDHTTFAVGSAGSFTVTTSPGVPAATTLTESGALPSGVTFTDNGNGTATLSGTPGTGTGGSYLLTLTASNGVLPNSSQAFGLTVTELPAFTSADHATFMVGSAGSFTVTTVAGFPVATALTTVGSLPSGVTFTDNGDGTATVTGTPAAGTGGSYPLTLTATNSVGHADQAFTLTVTATPVITSADHTTFAVGRAGSFTVTTSPTATTITKTGTLPSGVSFTDNGNGTATLTGTPAAGGGGSYLMTITASNGVPPNAVQSFTLTVTELPVITSANHATFQVGSAGSFTVTTRIGYPVAATLTEAGTLPPGVTFTDNGDGTATLAGTPTAGGSYSLTFSATNTVGHTDQAYTLTVSAPPVITNANHTTFTKGLAGTFTVTTSGGFPTPAALTETGALPTGVTFHDNGNGTATLSGTPTAAGIFNLIITANNGVAPTTSQSFTLGVNGPPVFTSPNQTNFATGTTHCEIFLISTLSADSSAGATVITKSGTLPASMTLSDNLDGTAFLRGCPTSGDVGSYPVTITATNAFGVSRQTFTLAVVKAPIMVVPLSLPDTLPPGDGTLQGVPAQTTIGQVLNLSGSGYSGNSPITIAYYPGPVTVMKVAASATGTFTATLTVSKVGSHTFVAMGRSGSGYFNDPRYLEAASTTARATL